MDIHNKLNDEIKCETFTQKLQKHLNNTDYPFKPCIKKKINNTLVGLI